MGLAASMSLAQAAAQVADDRTYEGDWYISDDTDNNTGERKVYAFKIHLNSRDPEFVTLTMRCSNGKPAFYIDWNGLTFPAKAVVSIGPADQTEAQYVFEKSEETTEPGLRASPETSAAIVSAIGNARYATITSHLPSGSRSVGIDVAGSQGAWSRVSRHCPVRLLPRPPL